MSPLSIAQFLEPANSPQFDVIIFDEASQVRPEDALGALLRGQQVCVMGDTKQLPPTSFFDHLVEMDEDEDADDMDEDAEGDEGAEDGELEIIGVVRSLTNTGLVLEDGTRLVVNSDTEFEVTISVGMRVEIEAERTNGVLIATEVDIP